MYAPSFFILNPFLHKKGYTTAIDADTPLELSSNHIVPPLQKTSADLDEMYWHACPGKGVDYPRLYWDTYGRLPEDWRVGIVDRVWTGYASDPDIRRGGASGGVMTAVMLHLLETKRVDGIIVVQQGVPDPESATAIIARTPSEVRGAAQSVYIPVPVLHLVRDIAPGERYAISCLPEQSAAVRVLQLHGHAQANQIDYVLGPYTGTALDRDSIRGLLRANRVKNSDRITSLKWRAGEWPGYLEIKTASGSVVRSPKAYYNSLIPFYVTRNSLQSMDFANEFADLSVGDAWSPFFEHQGQGFSVVTTRNSRMSSVVEEMIALRKLTLKPEEMSAASSMHGHMIDFKKRGGFLRNRWIRALGGSAPDCGLRPSAVGQLRILTEVVISTLFLIGRTAAARRIMEWVPQGPLGWLFNRLRIIWKAASKPVKRKGLSKLRMRVRIPSWKK